MLSGLIGKERRKEQSREEKKGKDLKECESWQ